MDRYNLGVWPCCAHAQLSISYLYVSLEVFQTPHDGLYRVAAAHICCFSWRCMRAVQSACRRVLQCAHCVYAGRLHMREAHTYIITGLERSAKVFSAKLRILCQNVKVFSLESFPLYGMCAIFVKNSAPNSLFIRLLHLYFTLLHTQGINQRHCYYNISATALLLHTATYMLYTATQ